MGPSWFTLSLYIVVAWKTFASDRERPVQTFYSFLTKIAY